MVAPPGDRSKTRRH